MYLRICRSGYVGSTDFDPWLRLFRIRKEQGVLRGSARAASTHSSILLLLYKFISHSAGLLLLTLHQKFLVCIDWQRRGREEPWAFVQLLYTLRIYSVPHAGLNTEHGAVTWRGVVFTLMWEKGKSEWTENKHERCKLEQRCEWNKQWLLLGVTDVPSVNWIINDSSLEFSFRWKLKSWKGTNHMKIREEPSVLKQRCWVKMSCLQRGPERRLGCSEWGMGDGCGGGQGPVAMLEVCLGSRVWWGSLQGFLLESGMFWFKKTMFCFMENSFKEQLWA